MYKKKVMSSLVGNRLIIYFSLKPQFKYCHYISRDSIEKVLSKQYYVKLQHVGPYRIYIISNNYKLEIVNRNTDPDIEYLVPKLIRYGCSSHEYQKFYENEEYGKFEFIIDEYYYLSLKKKLNKFKKKFNDIIPQFGNDSIQLLILDECYTSLTAGNDYWAACHILNFNESDDIHNFGNQYGYNIYCYYQIIKQILNKYTKLTDLIIIKIIEFCTNETIDYSKIITMWGRTSGDFCFILK